MVAPYCDTYLGYGGSLLALWIACYCHPDLDFTHFLKTVVEVTALGPPHVTRLWLAVSNGMLVLECLVSSTSSSCVVWIPRRPYGCLKVEANLVTLSCGDIQGFMAVVSVLSACLSGVAHSWMTHRSNK